MDLDEAYELYLSKRNEIMKTYQVTEEENNNMEIV
jgi:hypothetical protein